MNRDEAPTLTRRRFLQLSLGGTAALTVLGGTAACTRRPEGPAEGRRFLTATDEVLFTALLPAVAGPAWPKTPESVGAQRQAALQQIDQTCASLGAHAQGELRKLLDLLQVGAFRRFVAGLRRPWEEAEVADVQAFLDRWQRSGMSLLNAGYRVLVRLAAAGFWGQPENWAAAGYPGPPAFALQALQA